MKRKRPEMTESSDEEVEKESTTRRSSVRIRKKVRHYEDLPTHEELLFVTCGTKDGLLYTEKLEKGKACVWCEGKWFTPPDFGSFGGKLARNWKSNIIHEGQSLKYLLEKKTLTTIGYKTGRTTKKKSANHESKEPSEGDDEGIEYENVSPVAVHLSDRDVTEDHETFTLSKKATMSLNRLLEREQLRIQGCFGEPSTSSTVTQPEARLPADGNQKSVESWRVPLSEESQSEQERDDDAPATAATPDAAPSLKTEPPTTEVILSEPQTVLEIDRPQENAEQPAVGSDDHDATRSPQSESEQETQHTISDNIRASNEAAVASQSEGCGVDSLTSNGSPTEGAIALHSGHLHCVDQTGAHSSNMAGAAERSDVETMDSDQLTREKLELQVKVLRLQEKYYSLKISRFSKTEPLPESLPNSL